MSAFALQKGKRGPDVRKGIRTLGKLILVGLVLLLELPHVGGVLVEEDLRPQQVSRKPKHQERRAAQLTVPYAFLNPTILPLACSNLSAGSCTL